MLCRHNFKTVKYNQDTIQTNRSNSRSEKSNDHRILFISKRFKLDIRSELRNLSKIESKLRQNSHLNKNAFDRAQFFLKIIKNVFFESSLFDSHIDSLDFRIFQWMLKYVLRDFKVRVCFAKIINFSRIVVFHCSLFLTTQSQLIETRMNEALCSKHQKSKYDMFEFNILVVEFEFLFQRMSIIRFSNNRTRTNFFRAILNRFIRHFNFILSKTMTLEFNLSLSYYQKICDIQFVMFDLNFTKIDIVDFCWHKYFFLNHETIFSLSIDIIISYEFKYTNDWSLRLSNHNDKLNRKKVDLLKKLFRSFEAQCNYKNTFKLTRQIQIVMKNYVDSRSHFDMIIEKMRWRHQKMWHTKIKRKFDIYDDINSSWILKFAKHTMSLIFSS